MLSRFFSIILRWLLYSLFGILLFLLTSVFLKNITTSRCITRITGQDSCYFNISRIIDGKGDNANKIVLFIESKPCASCTEKAILDLFSLLPDSMSVFKPYLVFHPTIDIDSVVIEDYHSRFDEEFKVLVSNNDSIREMNPWLPQDMGFYGIVTDSTGLVDYAGFLFDDEFIHCCFKKINTSSES